MALFIIKINFKHLSYLLILSTTLGTDYKTANDHNIFYQSDWLMTGKSIYDGYSDRWYMLCIAGIPCSSSPVTLPVFMFRSYSGKLLLEISIRILCPFRNSWLTASRLMTYSLMSPGRTYSGERAFRSLQELFERISSYDDFQQDY